MNSWTLFVCGSVSAEFTLVFIDHKSTGLFAPDTALGGGRGD